MIDYAPLEAKLDAMWAACSKPGKPAFLCWKGLWMRTDKPGMVSDDGSTFRDMTEDDRFKLRPLFRAMRESAGE